MNRAELVALLGVAAFAACNVYDPSLLTGGGKAGSGPAAHGGSLTTGGNSPGGSENAGRGGSAAQGGQSGNGGTSSPDAGAAGEDTPTGGTMTGGTSMGGAAGSAGSGQTGGTGGTASGSGGTPGWFGGNAAGAGGDGNAGMSGGGMAGQSGTSGSSGAGGSMGTVVLLTGTASADSSQSNHLPADGNDGSATTRWCAANSATNHYWTLDLGSVRSLVRFEVIWEYPTPAVGLSYGYVVSVSGDGTTFTPAIDRSATTDTMQTQTSDFPPSTSARHVRVTVSSLPPATWASFFEVRVFGY